MTASNVFVSVANPDALMAGVHPSCSFPAAFVQLFRYVNEDSARDDTDGTGGIPVTTFILIAASEPISAESGPFRFGYYDSGAIGTSWYRYRFTDAAVTTFSPLSYPWLISQRVETSLRELIFEVGSSMGETVKRGTATAGASDSITCAKLFKSSVVDSRWYRGSHLWIEQSTDGLAPQGQEQIVASVDTAAGIAALDNELTAAIGVGDIFQVHALAPVAEVIRCINRVRERMFMERHYQLAIDRTNTAGNRYTLPSAIRNKSDVLDVREVQYHTNSTWQSVAEMHYEVEVDGDRATLVFFTMPETNVLDIVYEESYRQMEGLLLDGSDVTRAPIEWLRRAAAWEIYRWIYEGEDNVASRYGAKMGVTMEEVQALSGRYAPSIVRRMKTGAREPIGPRRGSF